MIKFSIIVPIYNISKYLDACLNSILDQSYKNFEVVMVNDGSTDSSLEIMQGFEKRDKRFKCFTKKNGGLSDARNYGISKATGDYFLLIDGDDTINGDLLKEIAKEIEKVENVDLVKFGITRNEDSNKIDCFSKLNGEEAFLKLVKDSLFVTACTYAYNKKYFIDNGFKYEKGRVHEDFGLTPLVIIKAKSVSSINYVGYNYIVRDNSIMTSNTISNLKKKNKDVLYFFDSYISILSNCNIDSWTKKVFLSYIANVLIDRIKILNGNLQKEYMIDLKNRKVYKYLLDDTLIRKLKKYFYKIMPNLYVNIFVR